MKKTKNKKQQQQPKVSTFYIMQVIMPCVMLACKDVFKAKPKQLQELATRTQRYINSIANGSVSLKELHELMEVKDVKEEQMQIQIEK